VIASVPTLKPAVAWVGALAGLSSGAALVLTIISGWSLAISVVFIAFPGLVAIAAISVVLRRQEQALFLSRLRVGALAGALATAGYDGTRLLLEQLGLAPGRSFMAIPLFGTGLTGRPATDALAVTAGWAFHLTNGIGFATAYALVAGGRAWYLAIAFAMFLEVMMVSLYPGWLRVPLTTEFLSLSVAGHFVYGTILGLVVTRAR
jgi:hypothetical protein